MKSLSLLEKQIEAEMCSDARIEFRAAAMQTVKCSELSCRAVLSDTRYPERVQMMTILYSSPAQREIDLVCAVKAMLERTDTIAGLSGLHLKLNPAADTRGMGKEMMRRIFYALRETLAYATSSGLTPEGASFFVNSGFALIDQKKPVPVYLRQGRSIASICHEDKISCVDMWMDTITSAVAIADMSSTSSRNRLFSALALPCS